MSVHVIAISLSIIGRTITQRICPPCPRHTPLSILLFPPSHPTKNPKRSPTWCISSPDRLIPRPITRTSFRDGRKDCWIGSCRWMSMRRRIRVRDRLGVLRRVNNKIKAKDQLKGMFRTRTLAILATRTPARSIPRKTPIPAKTNTILRTLNLTRIKTRTLNRPRINKRNRLKQHRGIFIVQISNSRSFSGKSEGWMESWGVDGGCCCGSCEFRLFLFLFGLACLRSRALALPAWNRDKPIANLLAFDLRTECYNSARHLQTRPLHPQTHPVQLFDVLERICGTAPNRDLGLCDEARKCCLSCRVLFTFFSVARAFERCMGMFSLSI